MDAEAPARGARPRPAGGEWLEADGLGGFASGAADGLRTRRYHGLLLAAARPPGDRWMLVNGVEAWLETPEGAREPLSSQRYRGGVVHPRGVDRLRGFEPLPWPTWTFEAAGRVLTFEVVAAHEQPLTLLRWTLTSGPAEGLRLKARLLCSGRDPHQLQVSNAAYGFGLEVEGGRLGHFGYPEVPPVYAWPSGAYRHAPAWFYQFEYTAEQARGLDAHEDLASPGELDFDLSGGEAALLIGADPAAVPARGCPLAAARALATAEAERRARFSDRLERAAASFVVRRGEDKTVVAGYPWFGDWGRDTFIALRGLRHLRDGPALAESVLRAWSSAVSEGMLPNRFPDRGETPEYNAVDASLWYVLAVRDHLEGPPASAPAVARRLEEAALAILRGYRRGTRHGIRVDADGLLMAGQPGVQLTWMDAKVGDWVVTPRSGKPVEVQALWLAALEYGRRLDVALRPILRAGRDAFLERFYAPALGHLHDVVDVDGVPGAVDARLRPNQVLALGGLGVELVPRDLARTILEVVEAALWTPAGLRTLDPRDPSYAPRYQGGVLERDGAYHQGTVWPWLIGPFVDAWVHARGGTEHAQREARWRFLAPLLERVDATGQVAEIADAEPPHEPRGAPFQAWSVTELLRLERTLAR
jgi:predicted glycogen debranching enzyme